MNSAVAKETQPGAVVRGVAAPPRARPPVVGMDATAPETSLAPLGRVGPERLELVGLPKCSSADLAEVGRSLSHGGAAQGLGGLHSPPPCPLDEEAQRSLGLSGDDGVSETAEPVGAELHRGGKFISHSTKAGFKRRPAPLGDAAPVGGRSRGPSVESDSVREGLGQVDATSPMFPVGQHEHPLSAVGSSDLGRSYTRPFRIEPEVGQSSQESSKPIPGNEASDVFHEDEPGSHFANQPKELVDEVALVVAALLLSGNRVRLARDASSDDVHQATKRPSIEGGQIIENRRAAQGLVFHPRQEDGSALLGVGVPLDVAHRAGSEDALEGEVQAPDS